MGRERELTRIAAALERAANGRMTTLLVTGTAGIGISRLLDETERRVSELPEPFTVIRCSTRAGRWGEPYAPVVAGFGPLLAAVPDEGLSGLVGPGAEPLSRLFPQLEPRLRSLGLLPDRPWVVPPERRQARLLEAVLGCPFTLIGVGPAREQSINLLPLL